MTTPENYQKMLDSQTLKATKDSFFGNGVFMFELKNLFKQWNGAEAWGEQSLKFKLINHVKKQGNSIVLLKIPTEKISGDLRIRSQEELFKYCKDKKRFLLDKHILNGAKAKDAEAFGSQSIEYIYPKNIDMSSVEKVGEVNIINLQQLANYDKTKPLKSFFTTLFNGHPEQKTAETMLNC